MKKSSVLPFVLCALFAALSAALAQVAVPLGLVPIVLTQIAVLTGAGLLGWKWGTLSQCVYIALGAAGLPVFARFSGGLGALAGPTGGFLVGYVLSALGVGLLLGATRHRRCALLPVMLLGALLVYLPGLPWLMHVTGLGFTKALATYMLPYLPGDVLKAVISAALVDRLGPAVKKLTAQ